MLNDLFKKLSEDFDDILGTLGFYLNTSDIDDKSKIIDIFAKMNIPLDSFMACDVEVLLEIKGYCPINPVEEVGKEGFFVFLAAVIERDYSELYGMLALDGLQ